MANTERLDLFKVPSDPVEQETTNFNTETMLNENWTKIDKNVALIDPETGKLLPGQENPVDTTGLEQQITNLETKLGNLPNLSTTAKDNLVGAINELKTKIDSLDDSTGQEFTQIANALSDLADELAEHSAEVASVDKPGHVKPDGETIYVKENGEITLKNTNIPGNDTLIAGDMQAGFFGETPTTELISGDDLADLIGLTTGTAQHSNEPWLKFAHEGKILFGAKKPLRYDVSWDQINSVEAVIGKIITIGGLVYKARLMRASPADPSETANEAVHHSEWNNLMLPIHEQALDGSWDYPDNVEENVPIWNHELGTGLDGMYNDSDLLLESGDGRASWCQETSILDSAWRLYRGSRGVSDSRAGVASATSPIYGWRPVLELVDGYVPNSEKGQPNGVATLDKDGELVQKSFITGIYTGDGESEQFIELGFTPSAVQVMPSSFPTGSGTTPTNNFLTRFGLALEGIDYVHQIASGSQYPLLKIVKNGFRVGNYEHTLGFNLAPTSQINPYRYIAYK